MALFENTYAVEIECYLPEGGTSIDCAAAITTRLAATGVVCHSEPRNMITRPHWKLITDGSLGDYTRGIEAVSPILQGEAGLEQVKAVMEALVDYGCIVSKKCGLHVHVGTATVPEAARMNFFRRLTKLYAVYEPVIDAFMPPSRRESRNTFCRSVTSLNLRSVERASNLDELLRLFSRSLHEQRYYKLNLAAYNKYRTVEFRQHSGTLEYSKAAKWIVFCLRAVESAKSEQGELAVSSSDAQINKAKVGSKTWCVGQLLLRPEGVTYREALEVTGWRQISLPPVIANCGLGFTTQRTGREIRYFARAAEASASAATPATLESLFSRLGCEPDERDYFRARTANLSGAVQWAA